MTESVGIHEVMESQLSTAVNQEEFLALKETLEDTKEAQTSYKVNR